MIRPLLLVVFLLFALGSPARAWWNKDWTARKKLTVDTTSATGAEIGAPIGGITVLVRLHDGNFNFGGAKEDGGDLRFVAEDDKTVLASQVEKFDPLLNEAIVWVRLPDVKPGAQTSFWLYSGNAAAAPEKGAKPPFDADTALAYHFADRGAPSVDSSGQKNNAETAGAASEGALIGPGLRLLGDKPIVIPPRPTLAFAPAEAFTWTAWVKQTLAQPDAILYRLGDGAGALVIGLANGLPYVTVAGQRVTSSAPVALNAWAHLAVVAQGSTLTLYVNGKSAGALNAARPALAGPSALGAGPESTTPGFVGEIDELQISRAARPEGAILLAVLGQGGGAAADKLLQVGADEVSGGGGHSPILEHLMIFSDIAKNMMFDGWMVIGVCLIMAVVGWSVAIQKFLYLNRIQKGSDEFLRQWSEVSGDLNAIDYRDSASAQSFGGKATPRTQRLMKQSPLYHIYHIGSEEIRHRLQRGTAFTGLTGRSIQAIRASLEAGLTREQTRLNDKLVFLTISIAGGPYVGLLGTVVGVMVTFAVIAKTGEVEVNSIAPGIASALLATVAGLLVAIPALFIYSYLNSRIKIAATNMQIFIDEFVTKMAEFYPHPDSQEPAGRGH